MKSWPRLLCLLLFGSSAVVGPPAFAYGHQGHQAIAELAQGMLHPETRLSVRRILGDDDLPKVACWADELKQAKRHGGALAGDSEARAFNFSFPDNAKWHFVDLPLGSRSGAEQERFGGEHDIIHEIGECIRILEGRSTRFDKSQALRLLIHLVGDIHQPLHVGSGYYDASGPRPILITDPSRAHGRPDDEGGNLLRYGNSPFSNLHAYWDETLVEQVAHTRSYKKLAEALRARIKSRAWKTPGDYHRWAEQWAADSVHQALAAYSGIVFVSAEKKRNGKPKFIRIRLPAEYERDQRARAADQLAKAGFHLAALLNEIQWK